MTTLYRKYRSQNFSELFGQNHIKITLQQEIATGKIAHAYLFSGPRGIGKTTLARILAKSINCINRKENEFEPCNKCEFCLDLVNGKSIDVIEIDAASHTGVDNVRENIISVSRIAPTKNKYKVFIIDEVHMLSISAFNALLKVLEEPPQNVIFILCTTEIHKIPSTIISRCERYDFKKISYKEIANKLSIIAEKEKIQVNKKILESIARHSEGHMRDAESLFGQIVAISGKEITPEEADLIIPRSDINEVVNLINHLTQKDAIKSIELINNLMDMGIDLKKFVSDVIEVLRKIMLIKINPGLGEKVGFDFKEDIEMKINKITQNLSLNAIIGFLNKFLKAKNDLKNSFIVQLPIEIAIAEICSANLPAASAKNQNQSMENTAVKQKADINTNLSTALIADRWNEVLAKIKKHNHSLSFILKVCEPRNINGNQLCLAFKYKFHKERMNDANIRRIIETVLNEVYGTPLIIEAIIDENIEANGDNAAQNNNHNLNQNNPEVQNSEKQDDQIIDNILKTFGGKIVK